MSDLFKGLASASAGMEAQARRLRHATENAANVDTPGYRRKLVDFQLDPQGLVSVGPMRLGQEPLAQLYDPNHPLANESGYHSGSNVELLTELGDAREAQRSYEANLKMFDHSRQMLQGLLELLRR